MALDLKSFAIGKANGGGGGGITVKKLTATENGTYTAESGKAFNPVVVDVPEPTGSIEITENGTYDVKDIAEAVVDITGGITAGFTSEKYKNYLEINGFTITSFSLPSTAISNFDLPNPLGTPASCIIAFRADLDGSVVTDKICFAFSVDGSTTDTQLNRLRKISNENIVYLIGVANIDASEYRAILVNSSSTIQMRYVPKSINGLNWASGDYYLAVR